VQLIPGAQFAIHLFRKLMETAQMIVITAGHDNVINGLQHISSVVPPRQLGNGNFLKMPPSREDKYFTDH
jgi:hypothetical protein